MDKIKVSPEIAGALDALKKENPNIQMTRISVCTGVRMGRPFIGELKPLNQFSSLMLAQCILVGYEVESAGVEEAGTRTVENAGTQKGDGINGSGFRGGQGVHKSSGKVH